MDNIVGGVQSFYNENGAHFSKSRKSNWPVTEMYLEKLQAGQCILDVGCGNGRLVTGLPAGVAYTGFDFSKTLLAEATKQFPTQKFVYGDVLDDRIWQGLGTYDAIFCVAVLHHIPEYVQQLYVLKEMKKHLKPGGFIYLSVWNLWQEKYLRYHLRQKNWAKVPYLDKERFCVAFDVQTLADILTDAGWDTQELFYADYHGEKSDELHGKNLVAIAC